MDMILATKGLNVDFVVDRKKINIIKNLSFSLQRGTTLALVGESGCGKSVTVHSIMGLVPNNAVIEASSITYVKKQVDGDALYRLDKLKPFGKEFRSLRGTEISMVFQDPMSSLNPVYKVGSQVAESLLQHTTLSKREARERVIDLFMKLGIPDPAVRYDNYPHELSGGMKQRIVIAIALICNPDLLIADEPTTALDVTIQAQIMQLLKSLQFEEQKSIILITHNMGLVAEMADQVCVMYMGRIVESGNRKDIFDDPLHPYTQALLRAVPVLGMDEGRVLESIPGSTPNPATLGIGCEFADRCLYVQPECTQMPIPNYEKEEGHFVRCIRYSNCEEVDETNE